MNDCWGRPGPGGTPWRNPKTVGHNFMSSMGWTTRDEMRLMNNDINDNNYASQFLASSEQQQQPHLYNATKSSRPMNCCDRCSCECIKKVETSLLRTSTSPPKLKENYRPNGVDDFNYQQNPHHQTTPKKTPHYALPQQCNRVQQQSQFEPLQPAQMSSIATRTKPNISQDTQKLSKTSLLSGGVELVPLLARRRDDRPISLSSTDITQYRMNKCR